MNKSRERAMEILEIYLDKIVDQAKPLVKSVILVGSLTTDSYTADHGSDIDLINVLRDDAPKDARKLIKEIIRQTEEETGRDIPMSRCVYRYSDLFSPYPTDFPLCLDNKDYIELPIEIMRIKDSGVTIWGDNILDQIEYPSRGEVIAYKRMAAEWGRLEREKGFKPIPAEKLPIRLIVQSVLVRAMLDYYFATGISCSNKAEVASRLREAVPNYLFLELADACTKWRYQPELYTEEDERTIVNGWSVWINMRNGQEIDVVPCRE